MAKQTAAQTTAKMTAALKTMKPAAKAAVAKEIKGAKVVKATPTKAVKPAGPKKETVRVRAVRALLKGNLTSTQVAEAVGIKHNLKPTLDQEVARGHLRCEAGEGVKAVQYCITAAGRKALEKGTIDPPRAKAEKAAK